MNREFPAPAQSKPWRDNSARYRALRGFAFCVQKGEESDRPDMRPRQRHRLSAPVRALCLLSLILAAFAHRPAFAYDPDTTAVSYVFPDGSVASNCLGEPDGEGKHGGAAPCEFCRIATAAAALAPPCVFATSIVFARLLPPKPGNDSPVRQAFTISTAPRGPPFLNA
jgi:hypothetical protein